jgi:glutamate--cysteine ligase
MDCRIKALRGRPELARLLRGMEKESLRVTQQGSLAQTPHPLGLGSALTHPHITTDFSEAQLEFITNVHTSAEACIEELEEIHRFVYGHLAGELLWTNSMPCSLSKDVDIPLGRYGSSNVGISKTVYRRGLGYRYGRIMQSISGIHYNFSIPDTLWPTIALIRGETCDSELATRAYFDLIRNFRRHSWLLIYLFGASPTVCKSFVKDGSHGLQEFDQTSLYLPKATSLRMGRLGYQSTAQSSVHVSYNSLREYSVTMSDALTKPYPPYEKIGLKSLDGDYRQLNTSLLQLENEFYGTVRPKRQTRPGERPIEALHSRGIEYVEVRCLDINPFQRVGIDIPTMHFLDVFLLGCLISQSPPDSEKESEQIHENQLAMVEHGRETDLELYCGGSRITRTAWASRILSQATEIAELIDEVVGNDQASYAVALQKQKVANPELTPSARVLAEMHRQRLPFFRFMMNQSAEHKGYFDERLLQGSRLEHFKRLSEQSIEDQATIEGSDTVAFDTYLARYLELQVP